MMDIVNKASWYVLAGCLFVIAGCGQNPLLVNQMTPELVTSSTEQRAELPARYFGAMCLRAGVQTYEVSVDDPRCNIRNLDTWRKWVPVVDAALNDIDERCDTYLHSLDQAKRDRTAHRRKLFTVSNTTNLILAQTLSQGSSALGIVETAFGFVTGSLDTYYSRLILETEKSSIETLVRKLRTAYRYKLHRVTKDRSYGFAGSYYIVKGYLRLCLPQTIEAEINSTVDNVEYVDVQRVSSDEYRNPLLEVLNAIPGLEREVPPGPGGTDHSTLIKPVKTDPDPRISSAQTLTESRIRTSEARRIQQNLCVRADGDFGALGSDTRRAISAAKIGHREYLRGGTRGAEANRYSRSPSIDTDAEFTLLLNAGSCEASYRSAFEKFYLPDGQAIAAFHKKLQTAIEFVIKNRGKNGVALKLPEADAAIRKAEFAQQQTITPLTRRAIDYVRISTRAHRNGQQPPAASNAALSLEHVNLIADYNKPPF